MLVLSQFALAVCSAASDLEGQERGEFGGLPTRLTYHLAGPPVYEPASPLASRRAQTFGLGKERKYERREVYASLFVPTSSWMTSGAVTFRLFAAC
jgi:hypothetical protein